MRSSTGKKQGQTRRRRSSTGEQKFPEDHGTGLFWRIGVHEDHSHRSMGTVWGGRSSWVLCIYCSPRCAIPGGIEESEVKESMWALEWRVGELFHWLSLYFTIWIYLNWIFKYVLNIELNLEYVFPMTATGKQSPIFISIKELSQPPFSPILLERSGEQLGGGLAGSQS